MAVSRKTNLLDITGVGYRAAKENIRRIQNYVGALKGTGKVTLDDHFLGPGLDTTNTWDVGSGTDGSNPAIQADGLAGLCRLATGGGSSGEAANQSLLTSELNWQADQGGLVTKAILKIDDTSNAQIQFGFTDQAASDTTELPFNMDGSDNLSSNASDAVAFIYDAQGTANWFAAGVKSGSNKGPTNTQKSPSNDTLVKLEVQVDANGHAKFFIDDTEVATLDNSLTASTAVTPFVSATDDNTGTRNVDVDRIITQMDAP